MAKLTLPDVANILGNPTSAANRLNSNNQLIEVALENTLSRDGTTPNQMEADLDLNNNDLLNASKVYADEIWVNGARLTPSQIVDTTNFATAAQGVLADGAFQRVINSFQSVLDFIPTAFHTAIGNYTILTDLSSYIQTALNTVGVKGGVLLFPPGRYPHASALVYGPQSTSVNPDQSGIGTTDIYFMQTPTLRLWGIGWPELYPLNVMGPQLTVIYQNSRIAPSYTHIEGMHFNGRDLAAQGLSSQYTLGLELFSNRFDRHTDVNFEQIGRSVIKVRYNVFRGKKCVRTSAGGDANFANNAFETIGPAASRRIAIELGDGSGNTVIDSSNTFTLTPDYNVDNTNADAIYINTNNRNIKIMNIEAHGYENMVAGDGVVPGGILGLVISHTHTFTGAQTKTRLLNLKNGRDVKILGCGFNAVGTSLSEGYAIILDTCQNVIMDDMTISGVFNSPAINIKNCDGVYSHDNSFYDSVVSSQPVYLVESSNSVLIQGEEMTQSTAWTTFFIRETGAGTGNEYGNNLLPLSVSNPYDVANTSTLYEGLNLSATTQAAVAAGTTVYLGANGSQASHILTQWVNSGRRKKGKRLYVRSTVAPVGGQTYTYTVYVDGVATGLTTTITGAATSSIDFTNQAAIGVGSTVSVRLDTSGTAAVGAHSVSLIMVE